MCIVYVNYNQSSHQSSQKSALNVSLILANANNKTTSTSRGLVRGLVTVYTMWLILSNVKYSRPKWSRGQNFGLGLASISLSYHVIGHFSGKNRVKFGNFVNFSTIASNRLLLIITWYLFDNYFWPRPWPQPPEIGLGLGLAVLASFNITANSTNC